MSKKCNKCLETKEVSYFSINKTSKNGNIVYKSICKNCHSEVEKNRRKNNLEKFKEKDKKFYEKNKEIILEKNKKYRINNKSKIQEQKANYYISHKEEITLYHQNNKKKRNKRLQEKTSNDKIYAIKNSLKTRLYEIIKNKTFSFSKLINTNCDNLIEWFEYQFNDNINWDNYGTDWHCDHLIPISFFNFEDEEDRIICFHWTNLRPLISTENIQKSNKICQDEILTHIQILKSFITKSNNGYQTNYENSWWRRLELRYGKNSKDNLYSLLKGYNNMDNPQPIS
jgi:hypothetical protein